MMMKNIRNMGWTTVEFDWELRPIGFSGFDKRLFFGIIRFMVEIMDLLEI